MRVIIRNDHRTIRIEKLSRVNTTGKMPHLPNNNAVLTPRGFGANECATSVDSSFQILVPPKNQFPATIGDRIFDSTLPPSPLCKVADFPEKPPKMRNISRGNALKRLGIPIKPR